MTTATPCCCSFLPSDPSTLLLELTALTRLFFPSVSCTEPQPGPRRSLSTPVEEEELAADAPATSSKHKSA